MKDMKKYLILLMFISIIFVNLGNLSAWEFDNTKSYNPELKEVTIKRER